MIILVNKLFANFLPRCLGTTFINSKIEEMEGIPSSVEEQPIAFGLKALLFSFAYPEEKDVDQVNNAVNDIESVSSSEMTDYRRALG